MKIAEAVRAAMAAAGIPYAPEPPIVPATAPEPVQESAPVQVVAPAAVKEKKPRVKKVVSAPAPEPAPNLEQNVVIEKKPTKPRQKKASA